MPWMETGDQQQFISLNYTPSNKYEVSELRAKISENIMQKLKSIMLELSWSKNVAKEYEENKNQLRQAEVLVEETSGKLDFMTDSVVKQKEEIMLLKEACRKVKTELHKERRLNESIKINKSKKSVDIGNRIGSSRCSNKSVSNATKNKLTIKVLSNTIDN
ncbi:hypothetical protein HELRODRAFT_168215 [Helobdella robusta]|uniref:Uncharacterized protein n=1 Tax=Helobdella robusta TaxID=6412 RepID=T1F0B6_HELRO|nr:hypothetical protein HELRODRAFT_168215 [Helobdella robusta]ESO09253.1 hypothetical protein HELRODRAFT_168215 [Helobdella robusta]